MEMSIEKNQYITIFLPLQYPAHTSDSIQTCNYNWQSSLPYWSLFAPYLMSFVRIYRGKESAIFFRLETQRMHHIS